MASLGNDTRRVAPGRAPAMHVAELGASGLRRRSLMQRSQSRAPENGALPEGVRCLTPELENAATP
eukprot:3316482-Alexandrium_andersonii.AAC.1